MEKERSSLGSKNRHINLKFDTGSARQETTEIRHQKVNDQQIADIVNNVERELEPTKVWKYHELVSCMQKEIQ